ncbi:hypothetical protein Ccrd_004585 [Cynara cardunculus var. scolymus]|uniref:Uncharacterized protein n=1 Tax=Cynara cardunculus var. scolymus TaxID=59895 RepID=A0A103XMS2_CYNCS|nr:hypothetical protein Ccrd_004585 [Cynara cardunculus var. scolymus]
MVITCIGYCKLLKEEDPKAWGLEPYDSDDNDANCLNLIRKGSVGIANIKFPLLYKSRSFSLVMVSDAFDYLSPKHLDSTLLELSIVSADGIVVLSGN